MSIFKHLFLGAQSYVYMEIYNALAKLGKIVSFREISKGRIGVRQEFINSRLENVSAEDKGIKSICISCRKENGSFFLDLKKFMVSGKVEIPFKVAGFTFNNEVKKITFEIGKKKTFVNDYYSKALLWFTLAVIEAFSGKNDMLVSAFKDTDCLKKNEDGTYTIDLKEISTLNKVFERPVWKLVKIDGLTIDDEIVMLQLNNEFAEKLVTVGKDVGGKIRDAKGAVNAVSMIAKKKIKDLKKDLGR